MDFTINDYCLLIQKIDKAGYKFCGYHDWQDEKNPCIIRHDVDFSIDYALAFSTMESQIELVNNSKLKATYFVLINTNFYNVFSSENRLKLQRIYDTGHDIGLHFDETQYKYDDIGELIQLITRERDMLSSALNGIPITSVSMHRPSVDVLHANLNIPGIVNSYGDLFFKRFKYFSDSRMRWREDVFSGVDINTNSSLHVLTHPIWYTTDIESIEERLLHFTSEKTRKLYADISSNFTDLDSVFPPEYIDKMIVALNDRK